MSIERKDVRLKMDDEDHAGLAVLARAHGIELGELAEQILRDEVRRRIHVATVIAEQARRLGISGHAPGTAGRIGD
jgi:hypothetical protein